MQGNYKLSFLLLGLVFVLLCFCYDPIINVEASQSEVSTNLPEKGSETSNKNSKSQDPLEHLSADELYQNALKILYSLRTSSERKRFQSGRQFDDVDSGIFPFSLRLIWRLLMPMFFSRSPIVETEKSQSLTIEPNNEKLELALKMLKKAGLELGHDDALYTLGDMSFYAKDTHPRNLTSAFNYYHVLATRSGNATAQHMIGFMYATGVGETIPRDQGKALLYHTFAALGGDTAGQMTLAYRYLMGIGLLRSCEDAIYYYKQVADKAVEYYKSGPPGGRQLPPSKVRLYDEDGGIYGYGTSGHTPTSRAGDAAAWDDILEYYRYMAERGDMNAQLGLGQLFYQGTRNIPQDPHRALHYLDLVMRHYTWPLDLEKIDTASANTQNAQAAATAAGLLGQIYWRGEGVEQDNQTALMWFRRGAKLMDPAALNGLGLMYINGLYEKDGRELLVKNRKIAEVYFKIAAESKYPDAQVNYALLFYHKRDYQMAYKWFELGAQHANFLAYYYLAEMNSRGEGTIKSCPMAAAYYKNVAERGDWLHSPFKAAYDAYSSGDRDGALLNYLIAAERGYEVGQANVAWLLDKDKARWHLPHLLPKPDPVQENLALIYWARSANQGNVDARVKMGDYYFKGFGTDIDYEKAAACYQVAAEADYSSMAMWNLGWMHENGIGVSRDFHLAKRWYDQSLVTNPDAYLPVTLSLVKLYSRSFWNYITGGDNSDAGSDSLSQSVWWEGSPIGGEATDTVDSVRQLGKDASNNGVSKQDQRREWDIGPDGEQLVKKYNAHKKGDDDFSKSLGTTEEVVEEEEESSQDDLVESLMILAMCLLVGWLVYIRQLRWNQAENNRGAGDGGGDGWMPQGDNGLLDDDNDARFAWAAGGGH